MQHFPAPSGVKIEPVSDRVLRVTWSTPGDTTGIKSYKAEVVTNTSKTCSPPALGSGQLTCNIEQLDPYTQYTIHVLACRDTDCTASGNVSQSTLPSSKSKVQFGIYK